jgi:hypothetical protein
VSVAAGLLLLVGCFSVAAAPDPALFFGPPPDTGGGGCVSCHAVLPDPRLSRPVRDAARGVHFERGVFCRDCHGGDAATFDAREAKRSGTGFVGAPGMMLDETAFCGRCHEHELAAWRESGHAAAGGGKFRIPNSEFRIGGAGCVTCHGSHAAKKASPDLINPKNCAGCHGFPESNALKTHIMQATTAILSTREQIKRFRAAGGGAFAEEAELDRVRARLPGLYHMTDRTKIRRVTQQIREDSARVSGRVKWLESGKIYRERIRVVWIAAAVAGALVGAYHFTVAFRTKKMIEQGHRREA